MTMWLELLKQREEIVHIAVTGAGASLAKDIWDTPGASEYFSGFSFPYAREEVSEFIGYEPEKYCSSDTAIEMAMVAYMKAYQFGGKKPVGIGVCASVSTNRDKKSPNRAYISVVREKGVSCIELQNLGVGDRAEQDRMICDYVQDAYIFVKSDLSWNSDGRALELILERPVFWAGVRHNDDVLQRFIMYPGAFNPAHEGHYLVASQARAVLGAEVVCNIELDAPNKPSVTAQDCLRRLKHLKSLPTLITKGMPLFIDKARAFPDTPMVIGTDALKRMLDPKWGPEVIPMLYEFTNLGTTFLVSPRKENGKILRLAEVLKKVEGINPELTWMFTELPEGLEISSTQIREGLVA